MTPPASPQCAACEMWKYEAVRCVCWNLRYALNEMAKELPIIYRLAEKSMDCPDAMVDEMRE